MRESGRLTRRDVLKSAAGAVLAAPWLVPAAALGRDEKAAPSERIALGVIGIGPRCTYDLKAMLPLPGRPLRGDRRRAGQAARGRQDARGPALREQGLRPLPRLPRTARPQGHRRRADRDRRPLARARPRSWPRRPARTSTARSRAASPSPPARSWPTPCTARSACSRPARSAAACPTSRRRSSWPTPASSASSTRCTPRSTCPCSTTPGCRPSRRRRGTWWTGTCGSARRRGGPSTSSTATARWRGQWDFDSGARLLDWGAHTVDLCQWANKADDTMPIEYEPTETNIVCRYANGVKLILDFLKEPFGDRSPHYITRLGTCPVRFVGDEGSVETGDEGEIVAHARVAPEARFRKGPSGSAGWT